MTPALFFLVLCTACGVWALVRLLAGWKREARRASRTERLRRAYRRLLK